MCEYSIKRLTLIHTSVSLRFAGEKHAQTHTPHSTPRVLGGFGVFGSGMLVHRPLRYAARARNASRVRIVRRVPQRSGGSAQPNTITAPHAAANNNRLQQHTHILPWCVHNQITQCHCPNERTNGRSDRVTCVACDAPNRSPLRVRPELMLVYG